MNVKRKKPNGKGNDWYSDSEKIQNLFKFMHQSSSKYVKLVKPKNKSKNDLTRERRSGIPGEADLEVEIVRKKLGEIGKRCEWGWRRERERE